MSYADVIATEYEMDLPHTCTIREYTVVGRDSRNQEIKDWTDLATDVKCRFEWPYGTELQASVPAVVMYPRCWFKPDQTITSDHRVVYDGQTFEVKVVRDGTGESALVYKLAELVRAGKE